MFRFVFFFGILFLFNFIIIYLYFRINVLERKIVDKLIEVVLIFKNCLMYRFLGRGGEGVLYFNRKNFNVGKFIWWMLRYFGRLVWEIFGIFGVFLIFYKLYWFGSFYFWSEFGGNCICYWDKVFSIIYLMVY